MYDDKFISKLDEKLDKVSHVDGVWDVRSDSTVKLARIPEVLGAGQKSEQQVKFQLTGRAFFM